MPLQENRSLITVSICICTRRRKAGLKNLLQSFEDMIIPPDIDVKIIIVENDSENFSESLVKDFSTKSKFKISYFLEPTQGLVYARNRSVKEAGDCEFCCFTDDDEYVSKLWLSELLRCQAEFNADGVAGPTYPVFKKEVPVYIKDFHKPDTYEYGTIISTAFTGCLLLRKKYLDLIEGPFDERLNFTGGEDINLTYAISVMGGVIRFNPAAAAYEDFQENRSSLRYIITRRYRTSNTGLYARYLRNPLHFKRKALPRLIMRFCNGMLIFIPLYIIGGKNKLKGLIKIVNAIGGFNFILGKRNQFYK